MSMTFASGRLAWGLCDRCAQRSLLSELRFQIVDQKKTELKVCRECLDVDHPQLRLGKTPIYDPQALRDPRPDQRNDCGPVPQLTGYTPDGAPIFT
jgi:hypothetical protein